MADEQNPVSDTGENNGSSSVPLITGIAPKRRGRPPGSKGKGKPIDLGLEKESYTSSVSASDNNESAEFIGEAFVSGLELVESFVHRSCAKKIIKHYPEKVVEFKEMCEKSGLQPKDKELAEKCAVKIASKYDMLMKHAPEFVLGAFLIQYGMRQVALIRFVENVVKADQKLSEVILPKA